MVSRHYEQSLIRQQAAMRCIALLAAHDERAMLAMVDHVLPAALGDSSELRWQSSLAHCSHALHARCSMPYRPSGNGTEEAPFSMQRIISCLKSATGMDEGTAAEGTVMQSRRICRLALISSNVGIA